MARSVKEIKGAMTSVFMAEREMQLRYGFAAGAKWDDIFSAVSVENILFYVVAVALRGIEVLLDRHVEEVERALTERMPHTLMWYRGLVLGFVMGADFDAETGLLRTDGMAEGDIDAGRVVRFAAVVADGNSAKLVIKVAGGDMGSRAPLKETELQRLKVYVDMVKDAGVVIDWVNEVPAKLNVTVDVVCYAGYEESEVKGLVEAAITGYIQDLPMNGEFTRSGLMDAVRAVDGVLDVYVVAAAYREAGAQADVAIGRSCRVKAGYMSAGTYTINVAAQ